MGLEEEVEEVEEEEMSDSIREARTRSGVTEAA